MKLTPISCKFWYQILFNNYSEKKLKLSIRFLCFIVFLFFTLSLFNGCKDKDSTPVEPSGKTEIKIGALFSISSGWTTLGVNSKTALEIAETQINTYLASLNSQYTVNFIIEDTELDPAKALEKLKSLKAQGVQIVVGPQSSAEVNAIKSYADSNDILIISQSSTAFSLAVQGDNIFRLCPDDIHEGEAVANLMYSDGITAAVSISRNDAGNLGLQSATKNHFELIGGNIIPGVTYEASTTDFTETAAALKAAVTAAIALHGQAKTAVYLTAFDEAANLFSAIKDDPVLTSVKWYGSDGVALSNALIVNNDAAVFANTVNYLNPIFGLDNAAADKWQPLMAQIKAVTGIEVDAFTLAAYDAAWLAFQTYVATDFSGSFSSMKSVFPFIANSYYGTSGWTSLNEAGDRKYGNFDFWGICSESGTLKWKRAASFQPSTSEIGTVTYFGCN